VLRYERRQLGKTVGKEPAAGLLNFIIYQFGTLKWRRLSLQDLIFCGHTWERHFILMGDGKFKEFVSPGGVSLVAALLGCKEQEKQIDYKREYIQTKRTGDTYYAYGLSGWTEGPCHMPVKEGAAAVVWDEGFGDIHVPESVPVLWTSNRALPSEHVVNAIRGRGMLLLDADVLRRHGAMISEQSSWEHSITGLVWQLINNPAISYLNSLDHIVITFAEDGAVHLYFEGGIRKAKLVLASGCAEGTLREKYNAVSEAWAGMVAVCALQFRNVISGASKLALAPALAEAERRMKDSGNMKTLQSGQILPVGPVMDAKNEGYPVPIYDSSEGADPHYWCISGEPTGRRVFDRAVDYVKNGSEAIKGLPQISFGGLTTVDRREIEAYSNIKNLIKEYAAAESVRPLSIVVFGEPGSGKSFGITEMAVNVLPGVIEKLEFNVSQFTDISDLAAAFHQVRDVVLKGKLPLVFFDEFDSDWSGRQLGWLKSFLMPMQDGKFKDSAGVHPIGKCILVFAGGTSSTFEAFSAPMRSEHNEIVQDFKNVKGPDFISRLRGTLNVLGPNKTSVEDQNYILRRALLLRGFCERKLAMCGDSAPVNDHVLKAMLLVPKYKYGARSMEAILDMSRIEGNSWDPASLPFYIQLSLHVDADAFIRLVLSEVHLNSFTEKLACAIHKDFLVKNSKLASQSFLQPWESLDEDIRESNRNQAKSISQKLNMIGYGCDAGDTPFASVDQFDDNEVLILARLEHERWMAEKIAAGWVFGVPRDNGKKIHPDLVSWENLDPLEQQKDLDATVNIIPLIKSVGLRVYKMF
jgi:hypothetical protein